MRFAPVLCRFPGRPEEWTLTTPDIFVSGVFPGPEADQLRELEALCEGAGAAVLSSRMSRGDSRRGDMAYITFADARHAAFVIQSLQGAEVRRGELACFRCPL